MSRAGTYRNKVTVVKGKPRKRGGERKQREREGGGREKKRNRWGERE